MRFVVVSLLLSLVTSLGGCGGGVITGNGGPGGADGGGALPDLSASVIDAAGCRSAADCNGGVCLSGACCPSMADVCGNECCGPGTTCLSDRCVILGSACHTTNDCAQGQYCEPALGGAPVDGGVPAGDGGACTQPLPIDGHCLQLPAVCGDGGVPDGGDCVAPGEYHPVAGPLLDAVPRWTWGPTAKQFPNFTDVWSTPTIARVYDSNCDGKVDEADPPNVVFVAGNVAPTNTPRDNGVLRMLDGSSGAEIWALHTPYANSKGFLGNSIAIGDIDGDGRLDIIAITGELYVVMVDATGKVVRKSDKAIPEAQSGWGGGVAIGDMDNDGHPEIAFGATVFSTTGNAITWKWTGAAGRGGGDDQQTSALVDVDGNGTLELLAGRTAYRADGTMLWNRMDLPEGFPGVGDFDKDGTADVVLAANGQVWILAGKTGLTELGPIMLPGTGFGGPPTVADFDGDGKPEIGVAKANNYSVVKPDYPNKKISLLWSVPNHDYSSSVTGSSVFDFEGDGVAEVVYGDECFLWVFNGTNGKVRFVAPTTSFTATESSLVADVDGDGRAELLMISNGASPVDWGCLVNGKPITVNGTTWTPGPANNAYRGLTVFGDRAHSWVGTRTLWNEHSYHVTNVCDNRDSACGGANVYGSIPKQEKANWSLPWLNDFRQNVQDKGLFDAPDATVSLTVECTSPVILHPTVRNLGLASLPAGVDVGIYKMGALVGQTATTHPLSPGQGQQLTVMLPPNVATSSDTFIASILIDPKNPKFHECRNDNNSSQSAMATCVQ